MGKLYLGEVTKESATEGRQDERKRAAVEGPLGAVCAQRTGVLPPRPSPGFCFGQQGPQGRARPVLLQAGPQAWLRVPGGHSPNQSLSFPSGKWGHDNGPQGCQASAALCGSTEPVGTGGLDPCFLRLGSDTPPQGFRVGGVHSHQAHVGPRGGPPGEAAPWRGRLRAQLPWGFSERPTASTRSSEPRIQRRLRGALPVTANTQT